MTTAPDLPAIKARAEQAQQVSADIDNAPGWSGDWTVAGDVPMIYDGHGDAIVNRMPDGRPYFEPEVAAAIVAGLNAVPQLAADVLALAAALEAERTETARLRQDDRRAVIALINLYRDEHRRNWAGGDTVVLAALNEIVAELADKIR